MLKAWMHYDYEHGVTGSKICGFSDDGGALYDGMFASVLDGPDVTNDNVIIHPLLEKEIKLPEPHGYVFIVSEKLTNLADKYGAVLQLPGENRTHTFTSPSTGETYFWWQTQLQDEDWEYVIILFLNKLVKRWMNLNMPVGVTVDPDELQGIQCLFEWHIQDIAFHPTDDDQEIAFMAEYADRALLGLQEPFSWKWSDIVDEANLRGWKLYATPEIERSLIKLEQGLGR